MSWYRKQPYAFVNTFMIFQLHDLEISQVHKQCADINCWIKSWQCGKI
jgi:hypothetical protein